MPITAKRQIPEEVKDITFLRTIIDWDNYKLVFQFSDKTNYIHDVTQGQYGHLKSIINSLKNDIPNIDDIEMPDYGE